MVEVHGIKNLITKTYPLSLVELESFNVEVTLKDFDVPARLGSLVDIVIVRPDTEIQL